MYPRLATTVRSLRSTVMSMMMYGGTPLMIADSVVDVVKALLPGVRNLAIESVLNVGAVSTNNVDDLDAAMADRFGQLHEQILTAVSTAVATDKLVEALCAAIVGDVGWYFRQVQLRTAGDDVTLDLVADATACPTCRAFARACIDVHDEAFRRHVATDVCGSWFATRRLREVRADRMGPLTFTNLPVRVDRQLRRLISMTERSAPKRLRRATVEFVEAFDDELPGVTTLATVDDDRVRLLCHGAMMNQALLSACVDPGTLGNALQSTYDENVLGSSLIGAPKTINSLATLNVSRFSREALVQFIVNHDQLDVDVASLVDDHLRHETFVHVEDDVAGGEVSPGDETLGERYAVHVLRDDVVHACVIIDPHEDDVAVAADLELRHMLGRLIAVGALGVLIEHDRGARRMIAVEHVGPADRRYPVALANALGAPWYVRILHDGLDDASIDVVAERMFRDVTERWFNNASSSLMR